LLQYLLSGTHLPLEQLNSAREQPVDEEPGASCKLTGLPGPKELEMELELDGKPAAATGAAVAAVAVATDNGRCSWKSFWMLLVFLLL